MSVAAERLEQALKVYEDLCRLQEVMSLCYQNEVSGVRVQPPIVGALRNWRGLRTLLLKSGQIECFPIQDWDMPPIPDGYSDHLYQVLEMYKLFPEELFFWTQFRRVYRLNQEFITNILFADYSQLRWSDVSYPFPCFGIELELPLNVRVQVGDQPILVPHDTLLVSRWTAGESSTYIRAFQQNSGHNTQSLLTQADKNALQQLIERRKRWNDLRKKTVAMLHRMKGDIQEKIIGAVSWVVPTNLSKQVAIEPRDFAAHYENVLGAEDYQSNSALAKIVVGLCLHLAHTRNSMASTSASLEKVTPVARQPQERSRVLTDETQVFEVRHEGPFVPSAFVTKSISPSTKTGILQGPQARKGSWRRKRGTGHIEDAPRFWYPPYQTHKELLKDGALVEGSVHGVKP